jgi:hypothetical protein
VTEVSIRILEGIPRWVIYLLLTIVMAYPIARPIGLPIPVTEYSQGVYDAVEGLKEGDVVCYETNVGVGRIPELHPGQIALLQHILTKPVKMIMIMQEVEAPKVLVDYTLPELDFMGKKYGEDYVVLGYLPGFETGAAAFATDIHSQFEKDYYGTPIGNLPMMENIKSMEDITIILGTAGTESIYYIRQWVEPYGVKLALATHSMNFPSFIPYYDAGQYVGLLDGIRGAAEYEVLTNNPGRAVAGSDALSSGTMLTIILVIMGNLGYTITRTRGKR